MLRRAIARVKELREMLAFESRLAPNRAKKEQLRKEEVLVELLAKRRREQLDQRLASSLSSMASAMATMKEGLEGPDAVQTLQKSRANVNEMVSKMVSEMPADEMRALVKQMKEDAAKSQTKDKT
jgi:hypothetical protein